MTLPRLKEDTERLYRVYYGYQTMTSKEIANEFEVIRYTARKVILAGRRTADDRYISVERLFSLYAWDVEQITRKHKELRS